MSFKSYLLNIGVVDTRAFALQGAVRSLHNAVACMDLSQRAILDKHCPELMAAANRFGQLEQGMAIFEGTQPLTVRTFDDRDPFTRAMEYAPTLQEVIEGKPANH
jgi:hypothetical protein